MRDSDEKDKRLHKDALILLEKAVWIKNNCEADTKFGETAVYKIGDDILSIRRQNHYFLAKFYYLEDEKAADNIYATNGKYWLANMISLLGGKEHISITNDVWNKIVTKAER